MERSDILSVTVRDTPGEWLSETVCPKKTSLKYDAPKAAVVHELERGSWPQRKGWRVLPVCSQLASLSRKGGTQESFLVCKLFFSP